MRGTRPEHRLERSEETFRRQKMATNNQKSVAWNCGGRKMAEVVLENICKTYGNNFRAIDQLNLAVEDGEFLILVGPSGCGKSTALRMIAGLEDISSGSLRIGGVDVVD